MEVLALAEYWSGASQEAAQLAETYAGRQCQSVPLGALRGSPCQPATFFGSGAVQEVQSMTSLQNFNKYGSSIRAQLINLHPLSLSLYLVSDQPKEDSASYVN